MELDIFVELDLWNAEHELLAVLLFLSITTEFEFISFAIPREDPKIQNKIFLSGNKYSKMYRLSIFILCVPGTFSEV